MTSLLHNLIGTTGPEWIALSLGTLALLFTIFHLLRLLLRYVRTMSAFRRVERDARHLRAMAKYHAKMRESDNRNY